MPQVAILMYHRICQKIKDTECYFARGTAVEPKVFEQQLEYLSKKYTFISLSQVADVLENNQKGKYCVLTFDDGYLEIKNIVWPLCKKLQIPICVFPIAGHTAEAMYPAYVDFYYTIIHYAKIRSLVNLKFANMQAPGIEEDIQWWVKGPFKEKLHVASVEQQIELLEQLSVTLQSEIPYDLTKKMYLSKKDLISLYNDRVEIGGHGYHHRQLGKASDDDVEFEINGSLKLLSEIGVSEPKLFCYPDGSYSSKVIEFLRSQGFKIACTVQRGISDTHSDLMKLPRVFMRNHYPNQEKWPNIL